MEKMTELLNFIILILFIIFAVLAFVLAGYPYTEKLANRFKR